MPHPPPSVFFRLALLALALFAAGPAAADRVRLKNGAMLEGVVVSESASRVVLSFGVGTVVLTRDQVKAIERSTDTQRAALEQAWGDRHYLHAKYVPRGLEGIAAAFRGLLTDRDRAVRALAEAARLQDQETAALTAMEALQKQWLGVQGRLAAADPKTQAPAYNALVAEANALVARVAQKRDEVETAARARVRAIEDVGAYTRAVAGFEAELERQKALDRKSPPEEARREFLARVSEGLGGLEKDFVTATVKVLPRGGNSLVTAVVNGGATGAFVVDTGASLMTLTEGFAAKLNLNPVSTQTIACAMADGRKVQARPVTLDSVQVGQARIEGVRAAILPGADRPGVDGLLGMSFLQYFQMRFDGSSGELSLKRFEPR